LPGRILIDLAGMRVAPIAAGVSLAHIGDHGFGVRRLDLERSNERVLGFNRHLIRPVADLDPDRILLVRPRSAADVYLPITSTGGVARRVGEGAR
jgi:hypothetical protein